MGVNHRFAAALLVASVVGGMNSIAAAAPAEDALAPLADMAGKQRMLELPVRVVDEQGQPIAGAKVTPWALRSSQGHGWWAEGDQRALVGPASAVTDAAGEAIVLYPRLRDVEERIATISVSLNVDHLDYAYRSDLHVDVPLESDKPHVITLAAGAPVVIRPIIDGSPTVEGVYAVWSDGRSWKPGAVPEKIDDQSLRIPTMPPGENSVLLVKLDGDRATHFSKIHDFTLIAGVEKTLDVELSPSHQIQGAVSADVERPVVNGRIKACTLCPTAGNSDRVDWYSWTPIGPDGTFTLDWPAQEDVQLIALCDGYIAKSGDAPAVVADPPDPARDSFNRPQVFAAGATQIELAMTPLVPCLAKAVDEGNMPIAGVRVMSWPNVCWWNSGSQIYCHPVVRAERFLKSRDYQQSADDVYAQPFTAVTDVEGIAALELPVGNEHLAVDNDVYELPVFLGRRDVGVTLEAGRTAEATLRLQPRGSEKLGDWDKLAGVVFGCSTREGRRICALPGVQRKMDEFTTRFREAKDQQDPQLLAEAYAAVAEAFAGVGDLDEAGKWSRNAAEQRERIQASKPE